MLDPELGPAGVGEEMGGSSGVRSAARVDAGGAASDAGELGAAFDAARVC